MSISASSGIPSPVTLEMRTASPSVLRTSALLSTTIIGTSEKLERMFCRSLVCFSMEYPQVSEGSSMNIMMSDRKRSARTACFSMSLRSSKSLSRRPGVSMIWYFLQSSSMWPMVIPLVVKGYGATSGAAVLM